MLAIAFDPSIRHTGVCVALDGKVIWMGDFGFSERWSDERRLNELARAVNHLGTNLWKTYGLDISLCIVEQFERHRVNRMLDMMKCSRAAGVIQGVMYIWSGDIRLLSKGTISKQQTAWLAKDRGVLVGEPPDKWHNALDAYQLLVCAGVCK